MVIMKPETPHAEEILNGEWEDYFGPHDLWERSDALRKAGDDALLESAEGFSNCLRMEWCGTGLLLDSIVAAWRRYWQQVTEYGKNYHLAADTVGGWASQMHSTNKLMAETVYQCEERIAKVEAQRVAMLGKGKDPDADIKAIITEGQQEVRGYVNAVVITIPAELTDSGNPGVITIPPLRLDQAGSAANSTHGGAGIAPNQASPSAPQASPAANSTHGGAGIAPNQASPSAPQASPAANSTHGGAGIAPNQASPSAPQASPAANSTHGGAGIAPNQASPSAPQASPAANSTHGGAGIAPNQASPSGVSGGSAGGSVGGGVGGSGRAGAGAASGAGLGSGQGVSSNNVAAQNIADLSHESSVVDSGGGSSRPESVVAAHDVAGTPVSGSSAPFMPSAGVVGGVGSAATGVASGAVSGVVSGAGVAAGTAVGAAVSGVGGAPGGVAPVSGQGPPVVSTPSVSAVSSGFVGPTPTPTPAGAGAGVVNAAGGNAVAASGSVGSVVRPAGVADSSVVAGARQDGGQQVSVSRQAAGSVDGVVGGLAPADAGAVGFVPVHSDSDPVVAVDDPDVVFARSVLLECGGGEVSWAAGVFTTGGRRQLVVTTDRGRGWMPPQVLLPRDVVVPWSHEKSGCWEGLTDPLRVLLEWAAVHDGGEFTALAGSRPTAAQALTTAPFSVARVRADPSDTDGDQRVSRGFFNVDQAHTDAVAALGGQTAMREYGLRLAVDGVRRAGVHGPARDMCEVFCADLNMLSPRRYCDLDWEPLVGEHNKLSRSEVRARRDVADVGVGDLDEDSAEVSCWWACMRVRRFLRCVRCRRCLWSRKRCTPGRCCVIC